ncbi:MAG: methyltransferase domain-containing protein [Candidatus Omnitrophica bacterium]|nr:methyltransferase domain-containing protein [Candidatus Omnitrophota bacterium]MDD5592291.1 methyltransferase domain-containing protein [Candidatus Omnitrophota bacterium]
MSDIFDKYYKKYDVWYNRHKFAYLSEIGALKKVVPKKGEGLEIGVGTGRFASRLGIKYGVDPSENMLKISKKRGIDARHAQGERLPFDSSIFDYVAIIITLCFVKDPIKVLIEAKRVLKNRGKIIVGIIDKDSFLGNFYQRKKSLFYRQAHFFGVKEVTDLLKMSGFGRVSYYQTIYKFPDEINSVEKPKKGFGRGGFVVISGEKI